MNTKLLVTSLRNVALAGVYIFGVSQIMNNAERIFGHTQNQAIGAFAFLLLFVLSAATVSSLVFGQAVALFLDNKKTASLQSAIYSVAWLFVLTLAVITTLVVIK